MAFKQNLPIPGILIALALCGFGAFLVLKPPPEQDQFRQAVDQYVANLGPIKDTILHPPIADILTQAGRLMYVEFEKKDGRWSFARDLTREFDRAMADPAVQKQTLQNLGQRVSARLKANVTFKEGLRFEYQLFRDERGLVGVCTVDFVYPKVADQQRRGRYAENFRWKDGAWTSEGPGTLFDGVGP